MWYFAKILEVVGLAQVLGGLYIGISQDDLGLELKIAVIGVAIFGVGRLLELKFGKSK
ncbi:MAG: hypothetical protein O7G31_11270 [Calditrichaeota bacterium]|nr:hypothetical protein [candidate division KSB1 bacterium]MCZ6820052.1 hypothetical protein [Calditrichota bacterium]